MKIELYIVLLFWHIIAVIGYFEYDEIPLTRHKSANHLRIEKRVGKKFPYLFTEPRNNATVALYKYQDTELFANVGIGSPAQPFRLVLDTTWADTWVISVLCPSIYIPCVGNTHNKYDSSSSSTFVYNGTAYIYGKELKGFISEDNYIIGQLKVKNQMFAEMTDVSNDFGFVKADGIGGLGFPQLSTMKIPTVFYNIFLQNLIENPIFSIYVNNDKTTDRGGSFVIGSYEKRHFNESTLFYLEVDNSGYWGFQMDGVTLNGINKTYDFCKNGCRAAIDTGSAIIMGPQSEIEEINRLLRATKYVNNRYQLPCNMIVKLPSMTFTIKNYNFSFKGKELIQEITKTNYTICLSPFTVTTVPNVWFLGTKFLEKVFVIFDIAKMRIGLADSIN